MLSAENFPFALCKNIPFFAETGGRVWSVELGTGIVGI